MRVVCEEVWSDIVGEEMTVVIDEFPKEADAREAVGSTKVVVVVKRVMNLVDSEEDIPSEFGIVSDGEISSELVGEAEGRAKYEVDINIDRGRDVGLKEWDIVAWWSLEVLGDAEEMVRTSEPPEVVIAGEYTVEVTMSGVE